MKTVVYFKISTICEENRAIDRFNEVFGSVKEELGLDVEEGIPGITRSAIPDKLPLVKWQCKMNGTMDDLKAFTELWGNYESDIYHNRGPQFQLTLGELSF